MEKAVYFMSDHHFGEKPKEDEKVRKFLEFIEHIKGCETLFIVGDLFDFYFEYKTQIPKAHFEILNVLRALKKSGTTIYYIVGNHDFWVGDFFTQKLGIQVYRKPLTLTLQGRRIFIAHGDELSKFDPVRWVIRNKISISLFYWIHPDIALTIGHLVSKISTKSRKVMKWQSLYNIGKQKFDLGFDAVILGHIHNPKHILSVERGEKTKKDFLLLGDWIRYFSYARLIDGKFRLCVWE